MRYPTFSAVGDPRRPGRILLAAWAILLFHATLDCAGPPNRVRLEGRVFNGVTWRPVSGATVSWGKVQARTDAAGVYSLAVPAGVRRIAATGPGTGKAEKIVYLRPPAERVRLDFLLPAQARVEPAVLALDRGLPITAGGKDLKRDLAGAGALTVADAFGNGDRPVQLGPGGAHAHAPVWLERGRSILWGLAALAKDKKSLGPLGVYRHDLDSGKSRQIAGGVGIRFLALSPDGKQVAAADYRSVFVSPTQPSQPGPLQSIFSLGTAPGSVLSVAWGVDGRIYFTVDDQVPLDASRSFSRSRIASIRPDGSDYQAGWQAAPDASFRYPFFMADGAAIFTKFSLDGSDQTLWRISPPGPGAVKIHAPALRAAGTDAAQGRLYYIYQNSLHLRVIESGADFIIAQSVEQADCRP